jgi:hypothetical protein
MSFLPITNNHNINIASVGVGAQSKILEEKFSKDTRFNDDKLHDNNINEKISNKNSVNFHTFIIIVISAIIFITVISIYDVIKGGLNYYYSYIALTDPNSHNTQDDIDKTVIADYYALISLIIFAIIAIIIALITLPYLFYLIK